MRDLVALRKTLQFDEGLKLKAYKDTKNIWTIGIGHNLEENPLSLEAVNLIFNHDIEQVENWVKKFSWYENLDSVRQNVVLNMGFQLGQTRFIGFKNFINALALHNYASASEEMIDSKWAKELENRGSERAKRLAHEMLTGNSSM